MTKPKDVIAKVPPPPLPQEVQQEWVKAGAEVGWMGIVSEIVTLDFKTTPEVLIDAVPAFRFKVWNEGTVGIARGMSVRSTRGNSKFNLVFVIHGISRLIPYMGQRMEVQICLLG